MTPTCRACDRHVGLHRRGLCRTCHNLHAKTGTLHWFPPKPRTSRPAAARVQDFAELRGQGELRTVAAARIGVSTRTASRYAARIRKAAA
ncbi:hypothetical protein [Acrocarpospora sp. B8E8]|uniref:hypothetical protein n=1 Tax=Acrocarpospora sp. B8E8 TaxID=3153572 RepID=UPI00325C4958